MTKPKEPNQILKWLGDNLRAARKKKRLSQMALAEKANVDFSYYGKVERGEKAITIQKLSQISEALNIPISELFVDQPPKSILNPDDADREQKLERIMALLLKKDLRDLTFAQDLLQKVFHWKNT